MTEPYPPPRWRTWVANLGDHVKRVKILWRVCDVCGKEYPPIGIGVDPPASMGKWYCLEHVPKGAIGGRP